MSGGSITLQGAILLVVAGLAIAAWAGWAEEVRRSVRGRGEEACAWAVVAGVALLVLVYFGAAPGACAR